MILHGAGYVSSSSEELTLKASFADASFDLEQWTDRTMSKQRSVRETILELKQRFYIPLLISNVLFDFPILSHLSSRIRTKVRGKVSLINDIALSYAISYHIGSQSPFSTGTISSNVGLSNGFLFQHHLANFFKLLSQCTANSGRR